MAVKLCGAVLSSLFYDHSISPSDQEGLLLGKVVSSKTDAISDSQISTIKEEIATHIYAYISCGSSLSWYDSAGRVDLDALKSLLTQHSPKDVVGWYKFRRNSTTVLSMRERSVHKHLKETFPGINEKHFVFLLCGMQCSKQGSFNLDHVFYTCNNRKFGTVDSEVLNLGDTSHNEYKMQPSVTINTELGAFSSTLQEASASIGQSGAVVSSVSTLNCLNTTVTDKLKKLCHEVNFTEDKLGALRSEIKDIKDKIKLKENHLRSTQLLVEVPVKPMGKVATTVVVPRIDKPEGDGTKKNRLSSTGSSPSSRKMFDFENQSSLFDIRVGTETACIEKPDRGDSNKVESMEQDLICLDDDDDDDDSTQPLWKQSSAGQGQTSNSKPLNNHIRFDSDDNEGSLQDSQSLLSTASQYSNYTVSPKTSRENTNPFLENDDSLLTPQILCKNKNINVGKDMEKKKSSNDSFQELADAVKTSLIEIGLKDRKVKTLPRSNKNVENSVKEHHGNGSKHSNTLQPGANLGQYSSMANEPLSVDSSSTEDEFTVKDDILHDS